MHIPLLSNITDKKQKAPFITGRRRVLTQHIFTCPMEKFYSYTSYKATAHSPLHMGKECRGNCVQKRDL